LKRNNYKVLVNKDHLLDKNYKPYNLVIINEPTGEKIDKNYINKLDLVVYDNFKNMQKDALKENYEIFVDSSYRSYEYQNKIFEANVIEHGKEYASKYVAMPGSSEHQTGYAIDIIVRRNGKMIEKIDDSFSEIIWLINNCYKYGFILRYPKGKESITGYNYEPWHYRYVGINLASKLHNKNMTLEEYYESINN